MYCVPASQSSQGEICRLVRVKTVMANSTSMALSWQNYATQSGQHLHMRCSGTGLIESAQEGLLGLVTGETQ